MLDTYLIDKFFNQKKSGVMVEVGAAGPEYLSQSKPFREIGWRCVCVEPNPKFAKMHRDVGNEIYEYACSNVDESDVDFHVNITPTSENVLLSESFSSLVVSEDVVMSCWYSGVHNLSFTKIKVNVRKLDSILEEAKINKTDIVTIDVEGWELNVMDGFNTEKYRPKVIVLEVVGQHNYERYNEYMLSRGYEFDSFDETTGPNLVYYNPKY